MINIIVTFGVILLFILSGKIYEGIKRLLSLITDIFLKFLNIFGIKIFKKSDKLKVSKEFYSLFKGMKTVRKSKENSNFKPSINIGALLALILSIGVLIANLNQVSEGIITEYLYSISWVNSIIPSKQGVDAIVTSAMISSISFAISKLLSQWKETKKYRCLKRQLKLKKEAISILSSKELLDAAKRKDQENFNNLKFQDNNGEK